MSLFSCVSLCRDVKSMVVVSLFSCFSLSFVSFPVCSPPPKPERRNALWFLTAVQIGGGSRTVHHEHLFIYLPFVHYYYLFMIISVCSWNIMACIKMSNMIVDVRFI